MLENETPATEELQDLKSNLLPPSQVVGRKEREILGLLLLLVWPLALLPGLLVSIISILSQAVLRGRQRISLCRLSPKEIIIWCLWPFLLLKHHASERRYRIVSSVCFLLPFLLACLIGFFIAADVPQVAIAPLPPSWDHWLGTNGLGQSIARLAVNSAVNTYLISVVAMGTILVVGLSLGRIAAISRNSSIVMFATEMLEGAPALFLLLIVLAVFSLWADDMRLQAGFLSALEPSVRVLVLGTHKPPAEPGVCF